MTSTVQTVLGPVAVDKLGFALMHDHLKNAYPGWEVDTTLKLDRAAEADKAVERLSKLKAAGASTMLDPCPMELARDPDFMAEVSRRSGIQIICTTGLYLEQGLDLAGFPPYFKTMRIEQIQRIYTTELKDGIGPNHIRPGLIKCATGPNQIGKNEERAFRAAARTAMDLDVRITTHTTMGTMGNEQLDIFLSEGMKPYHVIIGHCDWNRDTAYHKSILDRGCYIGFDTIGIDAITPDEIRIKNLAELTAAGYARQIVLSHDYAGCWVFSEEDMLPYLKKLMNAPKRRYTYLIEEFIPKLREAGVTQAAIDTMTIENPRRYFAGEQI